MGNNQCWHGRVGAGVSNGENNGEKLIKGVSNGVVGMSMAGSVAAA